MKKLLTTAAVAAAFIASPAFAADITGARVEGVVGYDSPKVGDDLDEIDIDLGLDGVVYGLGLGYDFAVGPNLALGIDAEITESTSDFEYEEGADEARLSVGRDLYVGGRVTTAISDNFNLYGKLGYTNVRVKSFATDGTDTESFSENGDGIRAGIGGQFVLGGNSYVGAEYRYSNYEADVSRHQVVATLGVRF